MDYTIEDIKDGIATVRYSDNSYAHLVLQDNMTQDDWIKAKEAMNELNSALKRTVVLANEFGGRFQLFGFSEDADCQQKLSQSVERLKEALKHLDEVHNYLASRVPPPRPWWRRILG